MQPARNSGDELTHIVEGHGAAVFSLALRITADRATAEEIAQDVFLELWRTRPSIQSEEHLRRWLRRVAVHRSTDRLRRAMRRPSLVVDEALDARSEQQPGQSVPSLPAGLAQGLDELLQTLPDAQRAAIVLGYGEDELSPEEIAALLAQPVATVKSNLQRGLALLRRKAAIRLKEYVRHA